jgi:hypothetical protein
MGMAIYYDFVHSGGMEQESSFHPDPIGGNPPDGKIGIIAAFPRPDYCAFEFLDTFTVAFLDAYVNTYLVTGFQRGDFFVISGIEILIQVNHCCTSSSNLVSSCGAGRDYNMRPASEQEQFDLLFSWSR